MVNMKHVIDAFDVTSDEAERQNSHKIRYFFLLFVDLSILESKMTVLFAKNGHFAEI